MKNSGEKRPKNPWLVFAKPVRAGHGSEEGKGEPGEDGGR